LGECRISKRTKTITIPEVSEQLEAEASQEKGLGGDIAAEGGADGGVSVVGDAGEGVLAGGPAAAFLIERVARAGGFVARGGEAGGPGQGRLEGHVSEGRGGVVEEADGGIILVLFGSDECGGIKRTVGCRKDLRWHFALKRMQSACVSESCSLQRGFNWKMKREREREREIKERW